MGRLLLCAALLCLINWVRSEIQYVMTTPAMMVSGSTAKVCVNIVGCSVTLDVNLSLEHNGRNTSAIAENTALSPKYFKCGVFKVPTVSEAVPVAVIFSAIGSNTDLRERKTVVIKTAPINCMYQMDKPIYKPGQKVQWRLLCLDAQLKVVNQKITSMYLQDPSKTKIAHWPNPEAKNGVVSYEFQLIPDAPPGSYVITAERDPGYPIRQYIQVKEYTLPRYSVKVDSPQTVAMTEESAKFKVSAMYIYGEPLAGSVTIRYCMHARYYGRRQNCFRDAGGSCANMTGELGPDGTYSGVIDLHMSGRRSYTMDITVTEAGTGIQTTESRYTSVTSQPASLSFEYDSMSPYYKRGLLYKVVAKLTDEKSEPMPSQEIDVQINDGEVKKAMTDSEGRLDYLIDTKDMVVSNFTVKVSYTNQDQCYFSEWSKKDYPSTEYTVQRFYSYSGSFVQIKRPKGELSCGVDHNIDVEYIISREGTGETTVTFYYQVMSYSTIVQSGQKNVDLSSGRTGIFSMAVPVSYAMAPSADLLVYCILQNEMITDTTKLNIEKSFKNQVSMSFSEEKAAPGAMVDVQLSADPNSYCALRVIDSSLLLLNKYEQFSPDGVYRSRQMYYYGYNVGGFDVEGPAPPCEDPDKEIFHNGRYYKSLSSKAEGDAYKNAKDMGLLVGGNVRLRRPEVCDKNPPQLPIVSPGRVRSYSANAKHGSLDMDSAPSSRAAPIETVRGNFAETMMWLIFPVNTEGKGTVSEKVPDTITSWQGTAFCTSEETGFGMTRIPANITTSIPFFMELSLPYSCIRGETLQVKGVASNYLEKSVTVQADMAPSNAFTAVMKDGTQDVCVPSGGRASYTWELQPNTIGELPITASAQTTSIRDACDKENDPTQPPRKDTVVQTIKVEAEGIPQQRTSSNLVLVQNSKNTQLPISLTPPGDVVPDSSSAYVTVVSDLFGLPVHNLEDMVGKPSGCADQNLARMAVIPPVLEYLKNTGQLTEEIKQRAISSMNAGYQRHLAFVSGGAYRLFPNSIGVNSVTTAETFKIFESVRKYIYIDEKRQQQTLIWLENSQKLENGCFKAQGKPVTNQDGDHNVQYTASVAIAMMESNYSLGTTLLKGALECLKNASKSEQTISEAVLMLYVFTMADMEEYRIPLLEKLMRKAKTDGGTMHWERPDMPILPKGPYFMPVFAPAEVWITSYMLLCLAHNPNRTPDDLTKIAQISVWLVRQQNSHGGFASTRDTAVAIQALAAVARLFSTPNPQQTVVISRGNGEVATINLNEDNRLVAHRQALPEASGDYLIDVSGDGWALIQTTVRYNLPVSKEKSAYSFSISTSSDSCVNGVAYRFALNCRLSYHGSHNESGMALVTIRKLSGYSADFSSLYKMKQDKIISRFEETPKGEVHMYLENVPKEPVDFTLHLLMGQRVLNVKNTFAYVYSYYEETENGQASYYHPCAKSTEDGGSSPAVGPKDHMKLSGSSSGDVKLKQYGSKSKKQA